MPSRRTVRPLALACIVAGAAWLRFHAITAKSFWIDEGASVAIARMDWYNFARLLWRREGNMTLYYLMLRGWLHLAGNEAWIRGLSVAFALATLPVIYLLGKRLFGRRAGMAATVLLAVNAFHVRYSQEARAYTLVVFLVCLASLLLLSAMQRPVRWKWTSYAVSAAAAVYAQFYAVLVVAAHAAQFRISDFDFRSKHGPTLHRSSAVAAGWPRVEAAVHSQEGQEHSTSTSRPEEARVGGKPDLQFEIRNSKLLFRRALILFVVLTIPIWVFIVTTGAGPLRWLERPGLGSIRDFLFALTGNGGWPLLLAYAVAVVLGAAPARHNRDGRRDDAATSRDGSAHHNDLVWQQTSFRAVAFTLWWLLLPIGITLLVSIVRPVFLPRYLIICLPPLVLLAGAGVVRLPKIAAAALLIGLVALSLGGTADYYARDFDLRREDWRDATRYVLQHEQAGDGILFHANQGRMPFEYYARLWGKPEPVLYFPGTKGAVTWRDFMGSPSPSQLEQAVSRSRRVWLVLSHTNDSDPATKTAIASLQAGFGTSATTDFAGIQVMLFSR